MDTSLLESALNGVGLLALIGIVFGSALGFAAWKFAVKSDKRIEEVLEILPMAQCGGCGYPGCEGYARAVVSNPDVSPNLCFPGKKEVAELVAALTGKELDFQENMVATVRCSRLEGDVHTKMNYSGFESCTAASLAFGGPSDCEWGCMGLGECAEICPFDAITMVDDFPKISPDLCVGCGICVKGCPKHIIELTTKDARVYIPCMTQDPAKRCKEVCTIGCIYCKACIKKCPADACYLTETGLLQIDHDKCIAYGPDCNYACIESCPRDIVKPYPLHGEDAQPIIMRDCQKNSVQANP